jgi:creatinine amidohydrolase
VELKSVMLEENTRRAIRRALAAGEVRMALVPLASTEQHNEHLAMSQDTTTVTLMAHRAAERLKPAVVVTPTVAFGISEHWMNHKGTLTVTPRVFCELVYEICDSLRRHGFRHILLVNGHGGNTRPMLEALPDIQRRLGMQVDFCCYWDAYSKDIVAQELESGVCPGHAAEFETSVALAEFPQAVHFSGDPYPQGEFTIADPVRTESDRRFHREARLASAEKGHAMVEAAVEWLAGRLRHTIEQR